MRIERAQERLARGCAVNAADAAPVPDARSSTGLRNSASTSLAIVCAQRAAVNANVDVEARGPTAFLIS